MLDLMMAAMLAAGFGSMVLLTLWVKKADPPVKEDGP